MNAPWVHTIHFVTDGQIPVWMNTDNPHLHFVNHNDYIDRQLLPLFNSNAIEIGLHRIPNLSEKFGYFNDDMFLTKNVSPSYFFANELPVDMAGITRRCIADESNMFACIMHNYYEVLNRHFSKKQVIMSNFAKWFNPIYGKTFFRTLINALRENFDGLVIPHLSVPYLKSDWEQVWRLESEALSETMSQRFREKSDLSHFCFDFGEWLMVNLCLAAPKANTYHCHR